MGNCLKSAKPEEAQNTTPPTASAGAGGGGKISNSDSGGSGNNGYGSSSSSKLGVAPSYKEKRNGLSIVVPMPRSEKEILTSSPNLKAFSFVELKNATKKFSSENLLGEGGFGYVYKGWIHLNNTNNNNKSAGSASAMVVAVKKLKPQVFQAHKQWLTEVNYLGQLQHENLVKLIGYCLEGENRLLVYEFMPKGSLENHLFRRGGQQLLAWWMRMKVAIGAARGLSFLHNAKSQVIYRDFKPSNILLDADWNAKLCDFGLAKGGPSGDDTHVTTQPMGTQGYAAPEYVATGRLTAKSDVYSFGVVMLEIMSGRRAVEKSRGGVEQNLVEWAKAYLTDQRKLFRIMDTNLGGRYPQQAAFMAAPLALRCLHNEPKSRPSMLQVLDTLHHIQSLSLNRNNISNINHHHNYNI